MRISDWSSDVCSSDLEVLNLLQRLKQERGLTYILVSHDLSIVAHMCDELAVMNHGAVVEELAVAALKRHQPKHPYTRQLMVASLGYDREAISRVEDFGSAEERRVGKECVRYVR